MKLICLFLLLATLPAATQTPSERYLSATLDAAGALRIHLESGGEVLAPTLPEQIAFSSPAVSPNHETVGWMADYPEPISGSMSGYLVLYRKGHVIHRFSSGQDLWDWHFWRDGREVAYTVGPMHGGADAAILRDTVTGKVRARWTPNRGTPPAWAKTLRY